MIKSKQIQKKLSKNINSFIYKTQPIDLQKKLINHITKNGKKHKSEKTIIKSFKATQKSQKKNHEKITKLSLLNIIPIFRIIKLTDKKRKKKLTKEIPKFVSNYTSKVSLGVKYLVKTTAVNTATQTTFIKKLKDELLLGATLENNTNTIKNSFQTKALQNRKYFKFYRW